MLEGEGGSIDVIIYLILVQKQVLAQCWKQLKINWFCVIKLIGVSLFSIFSCFSFIIHKTNFPNILEPQNLKNNNKMSHACSYKTT